VRPVQRAVPGRSAADAHQLVQRVRYVARLGDQWAADAGRRPRARLL